MTLERIGEMVHARTTALQRQSSELAQRGFEDLAHMESDPELLNQVKVLRESKDWSERVRAWERIREMGPAIRGWGRALLELIHQADGWARIFAAEALAWHRCCETEAVPVLLATLESTLEAGQFEWSRMACGAIGRYPSLPRPLTDLTVPAMMEALDASDANVQGYAAMALGNWGEKSRPALAKLADLHDRASDPLRSHYMEVLQQIDPSIRSSQEARITSLNDTDPTVRSGAVASLGRQGNDSAEALPALLSLVRDEDADVRHNVGLALGDIQVDNAEVRRALDTLSSDEQMNVHLAAVYSKVRLDISPKENVSYLISGLRDRQADVRGFCAWALGETGSKYPWRTMRSLKNTLSHESSQRVKSSIERALFKIRSG